MSSSLIALHAGTIQVPGLRRAGAALASAKPPAQPGSSAQVGSDFRVSGSELLEADSPPRPRGTRVPEAVDHGCTARLTPQPRIATAKNAMNTKLTVFTLCSMRSLRLKFARRDKNSGNSIPQGFVVLRTAFDTN